MAESQSRRLSLGTQLDIEQILLEAQHRWLRPAEICEILRNYEKFHISPEPANRPPNGSLFLFDRKVLRYFRKDGHNWRKKKDGKTVKEAHERLKAGRIAMLHCYYAHGAENENFQRRSYWLLEEELSHIVLVHYREVKGSRTNFNCVGQVEEAIPDSHEPKDALHSEVDSSVSSKFDPYNYQVTSQITDTTSLNSGQASELEDAESAYNHQPSSRFHSFIDLQLPVMDKIDGLSVPYYPAPISDNYQGNFPDTPEMDFVSLSQGDKVKNSTDAGLTYEPQKLLDFASWENIFENSGAGYQSVHFQPSLSSTQLGTMSVIPGQGNNIMGYSDDCGKKQEFGCRSNGKEECQVH
ncbi:unnamed protein product [Ilex paraguariensis]|uniref:CG-1 domain-containing protein n=1 Tax=Ilex paraguariensis TaxID=185542 RepID=A0ABC8T1J2_9AQUA